MLKRFALLSATLVLSLLLALPALAADPEKLVVVFSAETYGALHSNKQ